MGVLSVRMGACGESGNLSSRRVRLYGFPPVRARVLSASCGERHRNTNVQRRKTPYIQKITLLLAISDM